MAQYAQRNHLVTGLQADAAHARTVPPAEDAHVVGDLEPDTASKFGSQEQIVRLPAGGDADQMIAFVQLHRNQPGSTHVAEIAELVAPHAAAGGAKNQMEIFPQRLVLRQRQYSGDGVLTEVGQQVHERPALRRRTRFRQPPNLFAIGLAAAAEEQHPLVGVGVEAADHDVVAPRARRRPAAPAAVLLAERFQRCALDEPVAGNGHYHLPGLDQAFIVLVRHRVHDAGLAR